LCASTTLPWSIIAVIAERPSDADMRRLVRSMKPFRWLARPVLLGLDEVPAQGPTLFVGNHTMFGVLDATLLLVELYDRRGIALRGLGDHVHFRFPIWRSLLRQYGVVPGTRENCSALFEAEEHVLVFPGGAREVAKRKGEKYQLMWKQRVGFARLAIRHGVTVVPFAAIGVEDAFDILVDADEVMTSPAGKVFEKLGIREDLMWPLVKGLGPTPIPRPERIYFHFGTPIDAAAFGDDDSHDDAVFALRDRVRDAVEEGIEVLLEYREGDPQRYIRARWRD